MLTNQYKTGFAALIGPPNTGKSTLLNALAGQKIAITANKPQTTRNQIRGIITTDRYQAILVDTPGIHNKPQNELHRRLVHYAKQSLAGADLIVYVDEPQTFKRQNADPFSILEECKKIQSPIFLVLNKIDCFETNEVMESIKAFNEKFPFRETYPISALQHKGLNNIEDMFVKYLPAGEALYHEEQITDQTEKILAAELIREQIFRLLRQEVPYGCAVLIDAFQETAKKTTLFASIYVNRDSQKGILLGKKGQMIRTIGENSRKQIEKMLGTHIFLSLQVKVNSDWQNNLKTLQEFGYQEIK